MRVQIFFYKSEELAEAATAAVLQATCSSDVIAATLAELVASAVIEASQLRYSDAVSNESQSDSIFLAALVAETVVDATRCKNAGKLSSAVVEAIVSAARWDEAESLAILVAECVIDASNWKEITVAAAT